MTSQEPPTSYPCWICGSSVDITLCKIDEYGKPVHASCYVARMRLEAAAATHHVTVLNLEGKVASVE